MKNIIGIVLASILIVFFSIQVTSIFAASGDDPITGPITNPITSPISLTPTPTPICKPGFGFGDKNHCHFGPPPLQFPKNFPFIFGFNLSHIFHFGF